MCQAHIARAMLGNRLLEITEVETEAPDIDVEALPGEEKQRTRELVSEPA